jgi:3',5'-cyclic AMP phosphodiesterase CpdA
VVRAVEALIEKPAFIVHLGDIVADPDPRSEELAREIFNPLTSPLWYLAGNHDRSEEVSQLLPREQGDRFTQGPSPVSYAFSCRGHRFVALEPHESASPWNGRLADEQFDFLDAELSSAPQSLTIFLHYPARPLHVPWVDSRMILENGPQLHALLKGQPAGQVRGVFSGHIHRAVGVLDEGIFYQSVPASAVAMNIQPGVLEPSYFPEPAPMFTLVRFESNQMIVSHHQA